MEREVGPFPVCLADVIATRLPFGRTGSTRDSKNAWREALHGVSRHTKRPGTWLEKPVEGGLPVSSGAQSVRLGGVLRVDCTSEECPLASARRGRAIFIPVGSNFPESEPQNQNSGVRSASILTVAVFGVTWGFRSCDESADISYVLRQAMSAVKGLRLVVMGRGAADAEATLRKDLDGSGVVLSVLLCVRGHISTRRGSAIAGIACGPPIVGYRGEETAFPITEAGVLLADPDDLVGIAEALRRVLCGAKLCDEMRHRRLAADQKYFSWDAITEQCLRVLRALSGE